MKLAVLGTGCSRCKTLMGRVQEAVADLGIQAEIEKVEDVEQIVAYGVMSTPALAREGSVLFAGRVPTVREIKELLGAGKVGA